LGGVPDDVENDPGKGGVAVVAVGLPVAGEEVNFNVAGNSRLAAELEHRAVEIGAGLVVPEAGMEDAQRLAVGRLELVAAQALMEPDALEEAFGRISGLALGQEEAGLVLRAPLGVEIGAG
jgi:hypothetical protein